MVFVKDASAARGSGRDQLAIDGDRTGTLAETEGFEPSIRLWSV
jgi:hypothetical protein